MTRKSTAQVVILVRVFFAAAIPFIVVDSSPVLEGAVYYVSPSGDDSNPGSTGLPWRSLQKVNKSVCSGDTVYFREGVWSNEYLWPGTTKGLSNAQFFAYPGEKPVIANKMRDGNQVPALFLSAPNKDVVFRGLTFSNNWCGAVIRNQDRITFDSCVFGYMPATSSAPGFLTGGYRYNLVAVWSSRFITFTNCMFTQWGFSEGGDDFGCPLAFGTLDGSGSTNCFGNIVVDCIFDRGGHDLLEIYSRSNVVRRCRFLNPPFMPGPDGELYGNRHVSLMTWCAEPNLLEDNDFGYCSVPVDTINTVACIDVSSRRCILRRNRFFHNAGVAVSFYAKGYGTVPASNYLYNNTMYWCGTNVIASSNGYHWYNAAVNWCHDVATNNRVVNNIIWQVGPPPGTNKPFAGISLIALATTHFDHNLTNDSAVHAFLLGAYKDYVYPEVPDLRPRSNSPCIEGGGWLTVVKGDSGSGTRLVVEDAGYFYDGWGIPGEVGDEIQLQKHKSRARIVRIDYSSGEIELDRAVTWEIGEGVALAFEGDRPDIGAHEYSGPPPEEAPGRPTGVVGQGSR